MIALLHLLPWPRKALLLLYQVIQPLPIGAAVDATVITAAARTAARKSSTAAITLAAGTVAFHHRGPLSPDRQYRQLHPSGAFGWGREPPQGGIDFSSHRCRRWTGSLGYPSDSSSSSPSPSPSELPLKKTKKKVAGKMLEVEQKFALLHDNGNSTTPSSSSDNFFSVRGVEGRLRRAGFVRQSTGIMVDWYYDTPGHALVLQDCWLRYRQEMAGGDNDVARGGEGEEDTWLDMATTIPPAPLPMTATTAIGTASRAGGWQLKRGSGRHAAGAATVYDETEGIKAVALACSLAAHTPSGDSISRRQNGPSSESSVTTAPLPISSSSPSTSPEDFVVLARIVTRRSRWRYSDKSPEEKTADESFAEKKKPGQHPYSCLAVDLDSTDFGHAVGEVEVLVEEEDDDDGALRVCDGIRDAKELIQRFLREVIHQDPVGTSVPAPPAAAQGKLERYLTQSRPSLYQALQEAGVMGNSE